MKFPARRRRPPAINIVSLIDILTILLIFFIVTTTFKKAQPRISIQLPESKTATVAESSDTPVVLSITPEEQIYLDDKPVQVDELAAQLAEIRTLTPGRAVALRADRKASFGFIIRVLDTLKGAGITNLPAFTLGDSRETTAAPPAKPGDAPNQP